MKMPIVKPAAVWVASPHTLRCCLLICLVLSLGSRPQGQQRRDLRNRELRDADHYTVRLSQPADESQWQLRKETLRKKLMINAGLWPEPVRSPLRAHLFGEKQGRGFSVSKVYFESLPGFFVTGNLYTPQGKGPFPAILTPHGHWRFGRLQNGEQGSIPGRCIDLARQGFVVFSIDMVGYNDSFQLPHDGEKILAQVAADVPLPYEPRLFRPKFAFPRARLHGLSLGGIQLWNGIRSLDFLASLPIVDASRMGVTGASGGATQSLLLMTADPRVKVAAPVNIIGAAKHPGCQCENIPNLWTTTSTVELAAAFSPRPLLLMSATEDPWTHDTPTREYPMIRHYYDLDGAGELVHNVHIKAGHNYNPTTRKAVYEWFGKHLKSPRPPVSHPVAVSNELAGLGDLRVFPDHLLPESALSGKVIVQKWIESSVERMLRRFPTSNKDLQAFNDDFREALALQLNVSAPQAEALVYASELEEPRGELVYSQEWIGRKDGNDWITLESARKNGAPRAAILLVYPDSIGPLVTQKGAPVFDWVHSLTERGFIVFHVRGYASGQYRIQPREWDSFSYPDSYNRSNAVNAIQDILTAAASIREAYSQLPLTVVGLQSAGIISTFAAAVDGKIDRVIVDLNREDPDYQARLNEILPVAGIQQLGGYRTAVVLLMQHNLALFNAGPTLSSDWYAERARLVNASDQVELRFDQSVYNFGSLR